MDEKDRCFGYPRRGCKRVAVAVVLLLAIAAAGCNRYDPDRYIFSSEDASDLDKLFTVSAAGDSTLPADGFSTVTLTARIHDLTGGRRIVMFTTSAGVLRSGGTAYGDTALVETDNKGRAAVELMSSRELCAARVTARVMGTQPALAQEVAIRFTSVSLDSIITFVEAPDSVLANGAEITTYVVRIAAGLSGEDRKVTFTTTQGEFIPSGSNSQTRVVAADDRDRATVQLRSPDKISDALITATVKGFTREKVIQFVTVPVERIIRFLEAPESAPADGATLSRFSVVVSPELLGESSSTITFETTHGGFLNSGTLSRKIQLIADAQHTASVLLCSPGQTAQAQVTATVKSFVQTRSFAFEWAPPDTIMVAVEKFQIKADAQMQIHAGLIRNGGKGVATIGTEVSFEAADSLGNHLDQFKFFNQTSSDEDGLVSAYMTPDGISYRGLVMIRVRLAGKDTSVSGSGVFRIID